MKTKTIKKLRKYRDVFCKTKSLRRLAPLLKTEEYRLTLMAHSPVYHHFDEPKRDGSMRHIEYPDKPLMKVLKTLNNYLQAAYFMARTEAAFGFILTAKGDPDPRNIKTNAQKHLGTSHLLNADMKDFFHAVKAEEVYRIFMAAPFSFEHELAQLLTGLTTYNGRLPMGAPTSPVLSNFAARPLDQELQQLADWAGWTYTRFVDDMTFSAHSPIGEKEKTKIRDIVEQNHFTINEKKWKYYKPDDDKLVTGLLVTDKVGLPVDYLPTLHKEFQKLSSVVDVQYQMGWKKSKWVEKYKQQIAGRVNFATYIMGEHEPESIALYEKMEEAQETPTDFMPASWMSFGYF